MPRISNASPTRPVGVVDDVSLDRREFIKTATGLGDSPDMSGLARSKDAKALRLFRERRVG